MLNAKTCLTWTWDKACESDEFRAAVYEAMGQKGPWKHEDGGRATYWADEHCPRCRQLIGKGPERNAEWKQPCPVPPPVTEAVEVIAERLMRKCCLQDLDMLIREMFHEPCPPAWTFQYIKPYKRIIVCLLALGGISQ